MTSMLIVEGETISRFGALRASVSSTFHRPKLASLLYIPIRYNANNFSLAAGRFWFACPPPWIVEAALRISEPPAQPCLRCAPMKVELWLISRVKPYDKNPRLNDDAVDAVAASIREFGFRQPIVVDADGVIICGHTRYKAAQYLSLTEVPVHVATDLTPAQIRAYRIADNQTASLAEWTFELL